MIELDIKISAGDLYDYMLMHTYNSPSGIIGSAFGAICILFGLAAKQYLILIAGIFLLLYLPWTLFVQSRKQALTNAAFQKPLHYVLDEEGITVSQEDVTQKQAWGDMVKAVSTTRSIIVYTSKVNATIFPKSQLGDSKVELIEMISVNMPASKVKIKE